MQFRRSGQRDVRRRRVLVDDQPAGSRGRAAEGTDRRQRRHQTAQPELTPYSPEAAAENQPPITRLIPTRWWTLSVLLLAQLTVIVGLLAAYGRLWVFGAGLEDFRALDLGAGSLSSWLASCTLLLCAVQATLIFHLRRHRRDDFRGRYRLWAWVAVLLLIGSMDAATSLHLLLRNVAVGLTGWTLDGSGHAWWILMYGLAVGAVAVHWLLEMKACRAAIVCGCVALCLYSLGIAVQLGVAGDGVLARMLLSATSLTAHVAVWAMIASYGRHVYLEAQGELPARALSAQAPAEKAPAEKAPAEKAPAAKAPAPEPVVVSDDEAPRLTKPKSEKQQSKAKPTTLTKAEKKAARRAEKLAENRAEEPEEQDDELTDDESQSQKLSKAERRRQRKQRRRQQRDAA